MTKTHELTSFDLHLANIERKIYGTVSVAALLLLIAEVCTQEKLLQKMLHNDSLHEADLNTTILSALFFAVSAFIFTKAQSTAELAKIDISARRGQDVYDDLQDHSAEKEPIEEPIEESGDESESQHEKRRKRRLKHKKVLKKN